MIDTSEGYDEAEERNNTTVNNPNAMSESAMIYRLNPDVIHREIEAQLKGYFLESYWNEEKKCIAYNKRFVGERLLNDKGIQGVMTITRSVINHINVLGAISDDEYWNYLHDLNDDLAELLYINHDKYDLRLRSYNQVIDIIVHFARLYLTRLRGSGERPYLTGTIKENIHTITGNKRGMFRNLTGR